MPYVFGHRGAAAVAPENTMASFTKALEAGADGIELDFQMTRDGHLVVIHDQTLKRTAGKDGWVKDHTLAELRRLDAGSWFDARFAGERIPTLEEVLDLARDRVFVNAEIKNLPYRYPGIEEKLLEAVRHTGFPLDRLIVSSFDHVSLERVQALEPRVAVASLFAHYPVAFNELPGTVLHPHWGVVDEAFMQKARAAGRKVNVWTANDPWAWERLVAVGVDGIITDDPARLREWLARRGA
ncbi:MAG TPA: glycerophosphodiester phosphodiesterase [Limnochordales bacterium]